MDPITILGLLGGFITTISFVPQVKKTWQTKSTTDFSLGMLVLLCIGILIWVIYGVMIDSLPVILSNAVSLIFSLIILGYKIRYK